MKPQQLGFAHAFLIVGLLVALSGTVGFIFWQNISHDNASPSNATDDVRPSESEPIMIPETTVYTVDTAVADINTLLSKVGCDGSGLMKDVPSSTFEEVSDSTPFTYKAGQSKIDVGLSYAYVQYGCGSQGSVALFKKVDNTWNLISEDARIYPLCDSITGQDFPKAIIDKCYIDERAIEPVMIPS